MYFCRAFKGLMSQLSTAPPNAVAPDLMLFQRFAKFQLHRIRKGLLALNQCVLKARRGGLDQDALLALAQMRAHQ